LKKSLAPGTSTRVEPSSSVDIIQLLWKTETEDNAVEPLHRLLVQKTGRTHANAVHKLEGSSEHWGRWSAEETPLTIAASRGWDVAIGMLVEAKADLNRPLARGYTALTAACSMGKVSETVSVGEQ